MLNPGLPVSRAAALVAWNDKDSFVSHNNLLALQLYVGSSNL